MALFNISRKAAAPLALALFSAAFLILAPAARAADDDTPVGAHQETFAEWVAKMENHFAQHPELMTTPGSGWKPFNRTKWFYTQRMLNGEDIPVMGRWNAFQRSRELQSRNESKVMSTTQWFSLGPANLAGRMLDIEFDPNNTNIVYAGAAGGGIWKSTDGGVGWFALDDELPSLAVGAVAVVPSNSNIIVIGTGEATNNIDAVFGAGIFRSTDGGATWDTTDFSVSVTSGHGFHAMEANAFTDVILAAATNGVFRSTDQGATWARARNDTANYGDVKWMPGSADVGYTVRTSVGGNTGRIFKTTDGGVTWSGASAGLPSGLSWGKTKIAVTAANPNYIYFITTNVSSPYAYMGIYRSTDAGASWTLRSAGDPGFGGQCWYNLTLIADPDNSERVLAAGTPLFRSVNGGTSWSGIGGGVHVDHHAIAYRPGSNNDVFVGSDGGIWESQDDGTSWIDRNIGLTTYQFYDICVSQADPLRAWGGTQDQGTDRWVNSINWLQGLGADGMVCNGHPSNALTVYGEIQFGDHRKSTNGGATWFDINAGLGGGAWVAPTEIDLNNGNHLYTATTGPVGTYKTVNGGSLWTQVSSDGAGTISISPVNGNVVWAASPVRYTTDDGVTWNPVSAFGFPTGGLTRVLADPVDVNAAFATFSSYGVGAAHVARTTDLGATWTDVTGDFPTQPVNSIAVDPQVPNNWFIGTDVGVWLSVNGGTNWLPFETGFPNAVVADLEIQNSGRKLRAGTHGRGMWEVDISGLVTGVPGSVPVSAHNLLFDAPAPNPIKTETMLRYAASSSAPVNLSIYDVQGRLVTVLAEHAADGIIRQVRWGTEGVAPGVYLALLRAGADEKAQKLFVVK